MVSSNQEQARLGLSVVLRSSPSRHVALAALRLTADVAGGLAIAWKRTHEVALG